MRERPYLLSRSRLLLRHRRGSCRQQTLGWVRSGTGRRWEGWRAGAGIRRQENRPQRLDRSRCFQQLEPLKEDFFAHSCLLSLLSFNLHG